jgi:hypothetical protein
MKINNPASLLKIFTFPEFKKYMVINKISVEKPAVANILQVVDSYMVTV